MSETDYYSIYNEVKEKTTILKERYELAKPLLRSLSLNETAELKKFLTIMVELQTETSLILYDIRYLSFHLFDDSKTVPHSSSLKTSIEFLREELRQFAYTLSTITSGITSIINAVRAMLSY